MNSVIIKDNQNWGCSNHSQLKQSVKRVDVGGKPALKKELRLSVEKPYTEGSLSNGDEVMASVIEGGDKKSYRANIVSLHNKGIDLVIVEEIDNIDNLIRDIK